MGVQWLAGLALLGAPLAKKHQVECGVEIQYPEGEALDYESVGGRLSGVDLDDELCSVEMEDRDGYKDLRRECKTPNKDRCRTFGLGQWNRTCYKAVALMSDSVGKQLCAEDQALFDQLRRGDVLQRNRDNSEKMDVTRCNAQSPVCKKIDGKVRLVGFAGRLSSRSAKVLAQFPHLFSLLVTSVKGNLTGAALPDSLRVFHLVGEHIRRSVPAVGALLRSHGKVTSLQVEGDHGAWESLDLSHFCGLDLHRFSGGTANVGQIPECWSSMKNLASFYCVSCMMTSPPTALRGLLSLRSFVAFRQSEVKACTSKEMEEKGLGPCKPSWETRMESPFTNARGEAYDREPRFACSGISYAFPFRDLLYLGWTNVEKVWLDGNFLTGEIPEDIAEVWPSLQSLDLYDNSMHGELPESLGRLDLVKFQVNGNNFSGTFPKSLSAKLEKWLHLGVAANPHLEGCLPAHAGGGMAGTQMRTCERDEL